eukprot:138336-Alexandrium_andersonii.AAC.1
MSASLVGSEMCIRDSFSPLHDYSSPAPFTTPPTYLKPTYNTTHMENHYPVSYTHLTLPTICSV